MLTSITQQMDPSQGREALFTDITGLIDIKTGNMKIGYVLSGGGARGFAHLGVLKLLEELHVKPYAISGTSAGAIVGALYSSGLKVEDILAMMKKTSFFGWSKVVWKNPGIFSMDVLDKTLRKNIPGDDFRSLPVKLFVTAADINSGTQVCFSSGPLVKAVLASSSMPGIFEPVIMDNMILADGAILNNFPVEPLEAICDLIIGSHVNNIIHPIPDKNELTTLTEMDRGLHMAIAGREFPKSKRCGIFIDPVLYGYGIFDVKKADELFGKGYDAAVAQKDNIIRLISGDNA